MSDERLKAIEIELEEIKERVFSFGSTDLLEAKVDKLLVVVGKLIDYLRAREADDTQD